MRRLFGRALFCACALLLVVGGGYFVSARTPVKRRPAPRVFPSGDWTRFDYDARRSGVGPANTGISAHDLGRLRRRVVHLDGTVDSSPIELHAVRIFGHPRDAIIVTTTYGRTIAIDAASGRRLWEFVPRDIAGYEGSYQITNATPVADPTRRYVYAASPDGLIRKLRVGDGREIRSSHWPARVTFDASHEKIAASLNISGSSVLVTTGGYVGDAPPYQGHVVLIDRASGRVTNVFNSLCSNRHRLILPSTCGSSDSAMWARSGAVVQPGSGRILVATGNGPFDGATDWGDSALELSPSLRLLRNWTPTNQDYLNNNDIDVGSTAPALLPYAGYSLAVQGGKNGILSLLNLNRMNGTAGGAGPRLGGELQDISSPGGGEVLTAPAVWTHARHIYVIVAGGGGITSYELRGSAPRLHEVWGNGTPGTSPIVAGGLLYVYDPGGSLNVYNPANGHVLTSLPAGGGHWNSPIAIGGRIVLPEGNANDHATSGTLEIYHLPGR